MKSLLVLVFVLGALNAHAELTQVTCESSDPHDPNITYQVSWYPGEQILPAIIKNETGGTSSVLFDKYSVLGVTVNLKLCETEYIEDEDFIFWFSCELPGDRVVDGQLQLSFDDDNNFSVNTGDGDTFDFKFGECK